MQIKEMFEKQIDRDIKGVIKVGQSDEENVYQELDEYVVTKELLKHFRDFFDNYEKGINNNTDKMGVWISGFFGSGKSHFLKILSHLLKNSVVEGKRAIEYFTDGKKIDDPMLIAKMTNSGTISSDVMLFNIDSKGSAKVGSGKEAIVEVFMKVFNEMQGYCGSIPYLAEFERQLDNEGRFEEFKNKLDEIAITLGLEEYYKLEKIVSQCEKSGVHTKFIPDYGNIIPTRPYTEDLLGLPVINIRYVPLSNTFNAMVKRLMDIVGSIICIVIFSPVMLLSAILVKITSSGPLIFKQERVGLHNEKFMMYKFRTMYVQTEEEEKKGWTQKNDPRVTTVGGFLRKTSLDEFPQLFNVLKGDMSLVGPRPERPQYVEKFREEIPRYMIKHQVRPGMTGWAQVNGYRGDTSIRKRIEHDLYYIENWTLGLDIKILFLTVFKGFINKNAY